MHPDERALVMGPLFHAGALLGYVLPPASIGALMVLLSTFDPRSALQAIAQERLNHFWAVPTMLQAMFAQPDFDGYDVSSVEKVNLAGTTITTEVLKEVERRFPGAAVLHVYGSTECGIAITILNGRDSARKVGSVGQAFPGVSVRVVDDEGNDVEPGSVGEIVVQSESCAVGYWGNGEATAAGRFPDGWARTGDLGRFDEERYLYFVDRKKDIIVTGGENVASADVEQVVASHPAVRQVAVVGTRDERWGEAVTACVVLESGQALTLDELRTFCRSTLAGFQLPRRLEIMEDLPLTAIGKIFKPSLRERLR
jgi:fatty-acyl-CoA synthase